MLQYSLELPYPGNLLSSHNMFYMEKYGILSLSPKTLFICFCVCTSQLWQPPKPSFSSCNNLPIQHCFNRQSRTFRQRVCLGLFENTLEIDTVIGGTVCWKRLTVTIKFYTFNHIIDLPHDKTNKMACAPSEDSDQPGPGHQPSLIRVFAVRWMG